MKSIINGLRYDTDKATLIGETSSNGNISVNDFQYWSAGLYRTPRSNRYFLAGEGGAMTRWARSIGNGSWTGGEAIHPMTEPEALKWAERYLTPMEVEAGFPKIVQDA